MEGHHNCKVIVDRYIQLNLLYLYGKKRGNSKPVILKLHELIRKCKLDSKTNYLCSRKTRLLIVFNCKCKL